MEKIVFVDSRIRENEIKILKKLGLEVVLVPKSKNVYEEVSSHSDIFLCKVGKYLIVADEIYDYIYNIVKKIDNNLLEFIIKGKSKLYPMYPRDISFNACNIGDKIIHNFKYTDQKILDVIDKLNYEKININQGYANCSIAVIDENSVITADKSIEKVLLENGIDVLKLDEVNDIKLLNNNGYSTMSGFIGGTLSRVRDNIIVTGDITNFKEYKKIMEYIKSRNLDIIDFKGYELIDYGGIITI